MFFFTFLKFYIIKNLIFFHFIQKKQIFSQNSFINKIVLNTSNFTFFFIFA